jgi:hypothetical protein
MATDVIRYSGDLKIATAVGGTMTFDTGVNTGSVIITGNLTVRGTQTYISSTNTNVTDNLLILNSGETSGYVTLGQAGIIIDRGNNASSTSSAQLIYDDTQPWSAYRYTATTGTSYSGQWVVKADNKLSAIQVGAIRFDGLGPENDGRLNLLGRGVVGMLSVAGQNNYASRVTHDDDIPNKAYVDNRPFNGSATSAEWAAVLKESTSSDTSIVPADSAFSGVPSKITTYIDGVTNIIVQQGTVQFTGLSFIGNTIRPNTNNTNLTLQTQGTGTVVVNNGLTIGHSATAPQPNASSVKIYTTSTLGAGSTGIMFTTLDNRTVPVSTARGELISARKALVLSIIF